MKTRLSIVETLEAARETQGMTQAELASRAGTSRVTVGRIEAGFDPKLSTLYELARALGLELTLVPKSLAGEVQAFRRSGGRALAQPVGASAPPSVVDLAAVVTIRPRLQGDHLSAEARQVVQQVKRAASQQARNDMGGQRPLPSSRNRSLIAESTQVSMQADHL
jgi:transcriptional regulator with XRE-family HTH domain